MIKKRIAGLFILIFAAANVFSAKFDYMTEGEQYKVFFQDADLDAEEIVDRLDASYMFYNDFYHFFDSDGPEFKFTVKLFNSKEAYMEYISQFEMKTESPFLFIQFSNPAMNELAGYVCTDCNFEETLMHYSCIQYVRSFVKRPPAWLEKGSAVYFEKSEYDAQRKQYIYKENLAWLQTLKNYISEKDGLIPVNELLQADAELISAKSEVFYSQAWSLVSFLLNFPSADYNRIIWDTIAGLDSEAEVTENNLTAVKAFDWVNKTRLENDYFSYIAELRTFPELVNDGIELYRTEKYKEAETTFNNSLKMKDDNFIPYYYLGLINYNRDDYAMAEFYFNSAIQMNGDPGLCYYALAINSYSSGNYEDALEYLNITVEKDNNFTEKVEKLKKSISQELGISTTSETTDTEDDATATDDTAAETITEPSDSTDSTDDSQTEPETPAEDNSDSTEPTDETPAA